MEHYVERTLHTAVERGPLDGAGRLPLYLRGSYGLERWAVFGVPFAVATPKESFAVKTMAKNRDAMERALGIPVAFLLEKPTGYRIGRMVEAGLSFIVPDRQVYLPFLGVALSEGGRRVRRFAAVATLSPQAQRLALAMLYGDLGGASVTEAAGLLGTSKMTASRAFDELVAVSPSLVTTDGHRRVLRPGSDRRALWQRLEPHLASPVAREHRLGHVPDAGLPLGGMSALCELSMLQDNPWLTLAATRAQERELGLSAGARAADPDEADEPACVVQVIRYEPVPGTAGAIDPLSAILSLSDEERKDPRVAGEVENVIEQVLGGDDAGNR